MMLLVARSFNMVGDKAIGSFSLNLAGWPQSDCSAFVAALHDLVPRVAHLTVTADELNNKSWRPKKDFILNRLVAAPLQLAAGTALVLDEIAMTEGTLQDLGVKNFSTVHKLVTEKQLMCDFSTYDVPIPLELTCLLVSK